MKNADSCHSLRELPLSSEALGHVLPCPVTHCAIVSMHVPCLVLAGVAASWSRSQDTLRQSLIELQLSAGALGQGFAVGVRPPALVTECLQCLRPVACVPSYVLP